jgi:hypothetical protein
MSRRGRSLRTASSPALLPRLLGSIGVEFPLLRLLLVGQRLGLIDDHRPVRGLRIASAQAAKTHQHQYERGQGRYPSAKNPHDVLSSASGRIALERESRVQARPTIAVEAASPPMGRAKSESRPLGASGQELNLVFFDPNPRNPDDGPGLTSAATVIVGSPSRQTHQNAAPTSHELGHAPAVHARTAATGRLPASPDARTSSHREVPNIRESSLVT